MTTYKSMIKEMALYCNESMSQELVNSSVYVLEALPNLMIINDAKKKKRKNGLNADEMNALIFLLKGCNNVQTAMLEITFCINKVKED